MQLMTTYKDNNYPIIIDHNAIFELNQLLSAYRDVVFIVDKNVEKAVPEKIQQALASTHSEQFTHILKVEGNETTKTFPVYQHIIEHILDQGITRNTCIVAIGGGVTGDFAGFVAATLLRGVDFIQVPTTILAHDSSVGGKVGINTPQGKNLVGAFYRPKAVLYDLDFLETLPYTEISSGYAEVYKHALLNGEQDQRAIEATFPDKAALTSLQDMDAFLLKGIQTKLDIVVQDEREKGMRKFLNLGHTFGHAIEYDQKIPHGHAVMIGILYQFIVANEVLATDFDIQHYINYFEALDYPLNTVLNSNFDAIIKLMSKDKKNDATGIQMVLLKEIGQPEVTHVEEDIIENAFYTLQNYLK